jgi:hypothetical protein
MLRVITNQRDVRTVNFVSNDVDDHSFGIVSDESYTDFTTASRPADFVCAFATVERNDPTRLPLDLDDLLTRISPEA